MSKKNKLAKKRSQKHTQEAERLKIGKVVFEAQLQPRISDPKLTRLPEATYESAIEDYKDHDFDFDPFDYLEEDSDNLPPEVISAYKRGFYESYGKFYDETQFQDISDNERIAELRAQLAEELGGKENRDRILKKEFILSWLLRPNGISLSQLQLLVHLRNLEDHRIVLYKDFYLSQIQGRQLFLFDLPTSGAFDLDCLGLGEISQIKRPPLETDLELIQKKIADLWEKEEEDNPCYDWLQLLKPKATRPGALRYANKLARIVGFRFSLDKGFYHQRVDSLWYNLYRMFESTLKRRASLALKEIELAVEVQNELTK